MGKKIKRRNVCCRYFFSHSIFNLILVHISWRWYIQNNVKRKDWKRKRFISKFVVFQYNKSQKVKRQLLCALDYIQMWSTTFLIQILMHTFFILRLFLQCIMFADSDKTIVEWHLSSWHTTRMRLFLLISKIKKKKTLNF